MQQKGSSLKIGLFSSLACHLLVAAVLLYGHFTTPERVLAGGGPALRAVMINSWPSTTPSTAPNNDSNSKINRKQNKKNLSESRIIRHSELKLKDKNAVDQHNRKSPSKDISAQAVMFKEKSERMAKVKTSSKTSGLAHEQSTMTETLSILRRLAPEYPRRALALGIEGKVIVRYDITPNGRVANVRFVHAEPNAIFNRSVRQAMHFWRYRPGTARDLTITIIFKRDKSVQLHG